jgi:carbamoyltransferase
VTAILGLNAYHADAAAALVVDGELVAAAEEERFTRVKHVGGFPAEAAAWCLSDAGLTPADLQHVAVGRSRRTTLKTRLARTMTRQGPRPASRGWSPREELARALGAGPKSLRATFHDVEHHQAHAASALFVSPFEEAAVLTLDAFGDSASTLLAHGRGNRFEVLDRVFFPHSLGIFYSAVTQWLGFRAYGDEGKVMGLAPYGDPETQRTAMRDLVRLGDLFELNLDYFTHHSREDDLSWTEGTPKLDTLFSHRLEEVFGPAREPDRELTRQHEDVAAALQAVFEEAYLHLVDAARRRTGLPNLCLAGGAALNAVANGRIRRESAFDGLFIQPAAGDSGLAVGAAFFVWNQALGESRTFVMEHAYTGPEYADAACASALQAAGLEAQRLDDELYAAVAERIAAGAVVGWFQGRMEFGPRALGNRSIVADPRRHDMKDVLNARIKQREPFRPFAPSILAPRTREWYEQHDSAPFMNLVYTTRSDRREEIPAVNHVDDTGRVQTVEERVNPRYYRLISEFERLTGVPIVLNTSFDENEPIVMTPYDAIETFRKTRMDLLVLGNYVATRDASAYAATAASVTASQEQ